MAWRRRKDPEPDQTEIQRIIDHDVRLAAHLSLPDRDRLIERTTEVIALAHWESIAGLVLTNEVRVTVAANAAIPVLALGTHVYRQVRAVIVRPTTAVMGGQRTGPAGGTMTDDPMLTSGVAFAETGPIAISWDVALRESRHPWAGRSS